MNVDELGLDEGDEVRAIMRRFYPLLLREAYADAAALVGQDIAFDLANDQIQGLLTTLAKNVTKITETTREQIQGLIGRQAAEGWSVQELAAAIREAGVTQSAARATLIARTETATAYSRGAIAAYQQSGVVKQLEWLTADSPCPICDPLDGMTVGIGKSFADGIDYPPAHPGCRCAIAPVV